jgi:hypothetical protein
MTKRRPDAVRGRPPKDPSEKRVLVKISLLPTTIEDLRRIVEIADRERKTPDEG